MLTLFTDVTFSLLYIFPFTNEDTKNLKISRFIVKN
jgi:hypothetical protein